MRLFRGKGRARGIEILGIHVRGNSLHFGQRRFQRALRGLGSFAFQAPLQLVQFRARKDPFADQPRPHSRNGIAQRIRLPLGRGTVVLIVVGKGMRVEPHAMAVHQRRPASGAAVRRRLLKGPQANHGIVAVHFGEVEVGKVLDQPRNVSSRRVHLDGNADGIAVVFHAEDHRQLLIGSGIDRLPEFALRGRSLAHAGQRHLVAVKIHIAKGAIVALRLGRRSGVAAEEPAGLGAAHRVE